MDKFVVCTESEDGEEVFWNGEVKRNGEPKTAKTVRGAKKFETRRAAYNCATSYPALLDWRVRMVLYEDCETNPLKLLLHDLRQRMPEKTAMGENGEMGYASRPFRIADESLALTERAFEVIEKEVLEKMNSKEANKLRRKILS